MEIIKTIERRSKLATGWTKWSDGRWPRIRWQCEKSRSLGRSFDGVSKEKKKKGRNMSRMKEKKAGGRSPELISARSIFFLLAAFGAGKSMWIMCRNSRMQIRTPKSKVENGERNSRCSCVKGRMRVASSSADRNGVSREGIRGDEGFHTDGMGKHDLTVRNLDLFGDDGRHAVVIRVILGESR